MTSCTAPPSPLLEVLGLAPPGSQSLFHGDLLLLFEVLRQQPSLQVLLLSHPFTILRSYATIFICMAPCTKKLIRASTSIATQVIASTSPKTLSPRETMLTGAGITVTIATKATIANPTKSKIATNTNTTTETIEATEAVISTESLL